MRRPFVRVVVMLLGMLAVQVSLAPTAALSDGTSSPLPASPPPLTSPPSPIPFALGAPPILSAARNVIVLLGAGDAATSGRLTATFANRLSSYRLVNDSYVVPEPTWTVNDFVASCKSDPTVAGALMTTLVAASSVQKDSLAWRTFYFQLAAATVWIACTAPKPKALKSQ